MNDIKSIIEKIRKLQQQTIVNGCTQNEAMISAQKISDLMQTYRIKEDQIDFDNEDIERIFYEFGSKSHPCVYAWKGIEAICGVKLYNSSKYKTDNDYNNKKVCSMAICGYHADVEQAKYLLYVIKKAIDSEVGRFRKGSIYKQSERKVSLVNGFALSMGNEIGKRLEEMAKENSWKTYQEKKKQDNFHDNLNNPSRDLVVVKNQLINTWLKDQGVHLRSSRSSHSNSSGHGLGKNAGQNVSLNKGIHGSRNQARIGN
jgi:hypothetical protein